MRALALAALVACSGSAPPPQPPQPLASAWSAPSMIAHVPDDSPYVFAALEAMPPSARDQLFASADRKIAEAVAALDQLPADFDTSTLDPWMRALFAFIEELRGKNLKNWGSELGFDRSGRFVLYGLSVWPVLRVSLSDPTRLQGAIERVLAKAQIPQITRALAGKQPYWTASIKNISFLAAIVDKELVAAVFPTSATSYALPLVLGTAMPKPSLRDTDKVRKLFSRYQFLPSFIGYFDARAGADILMQRSSTANTELERPIAAATGPIAPECREEIDRLVEVVPRIVLGYRTLDAHLMHATFIAELAPPIARALAPIATRVPDVTSGHHPHRLVEVGIAADIDAVYPLLRRLADHIHAQPFRCSYLRPLDDFADEISQALLANPLPPPVRGLRGLSLVVDEFSPATKTILGHALIESPAAATLVTTIAGKLLGYAAPIPPDGQPRELPITMLSLDPSITLHAVARSDRAVLAIGPDSSTVASNALDAPLPAQSPLMSIGMNLVKLRELGAFKGEDRMEDLTDMTLQLEVDEDGLALEVFAAY